MKYTLTYTVVLMSLVSVLQASPTRITIDLEKRKKMLERFFAGDAKVFAAPEIVLYGVADFYVFLDRVLDYPKNDKGKKLSDVATSFKIPHNDGRPILTSKKPPHLLSLVLVNTLSEQEDTESLQEIIEFFDLLIEFSNGKDQELAKNALTILKVYQPYTLEKFTKDWFRKNFYTKTGIGVKLSKHR